MKQAIYTLLAIIGAAYMLAIVTGSPASAIDIFGGCQGQGGGSKVCAATGTDDASNIAKSITSTLLWVLGAVAVIVIIISGFKYVTANGDTGKIQSAKNTLLYAIVGLVVAMFAQAIVLFVIKWV